MSVAALLRSRKVLGVGRTGVFVMSKLMAIETFRRPLLFSALTFMPRDRLLADRLIVSVVLKRSAVRSQSLQALERIGHMLNLVPTEHGCSYIVWIARWAVVNSFSRVWCRLLLLKVLGSDGLSGLMKATDLESTAVRLVIGGARLACSVFVSKRVLLGSRVMCPQLFLVLSIDRISIGRAVAKGLHCRDVIDMFLESVDDVPIGWRRQLGSQVVDCKSFVSRL